MKKEKKRIQVLRRMTEGEMKALGGNMWMRQKAKGLVILAVLAFAWMLVGASILEGTLAVVLPILPILALCWVFLVRMGKEGKKLWEWANGKAQPIDLDKYDPIDKG